MVLEGLETDTKCLESLVISLETELRAIESGTVEAPDLNKLREENSRLQYRLNVLQAALKAEVAKDSINASAEVAEPSFAIDRPKMKLRINPSIITLFPHVKLGILVGRNVNNQVTATTGSNSESPTAALLRETELALRAKHKLDDLANLAKIVDWREAYKKFGFKPSQHRSSVEALCRRVLQDKELPDISPIVNIYNAMSVKHLVPSGGDDLDLTEGDVVLTVADGSERFVMLGNKVEPIKKGEVVYRDDKEVLCRSWNYRESEKSKITDKTRHFCLVMEGLEHTTMEEIRRAVGELRSLLEAHCKGTYEEFYLHKGNAEATF